MSFFKRVGGVLGGILGARSGRSAQDRQFNEDWSRQYQIQAADFQAQRETLLSQDRIQGFWDVAQEEITKNLQAQARNQETKVEFGEADPKRRRFFTFGS